MGILDIAFNMWALVFVGPSLEGLLGRLRFLALYLFSAVGGGVMYYFLAAPNSAAVGASGAIFGLFGAWFVAARRLRFDTRGIAMLIALNLALSFIWTASSPGRTTSAGCSPGCSSRRLSPTRREVTASAWQALAMVALAAAIVVAVAVRNGQLTGG